jgi:hypothetical protein
MFRILHKEDKNEWNALLERAGCRDPFFQPEYVALNEIILGGRAECFVYEDSKTLVVYPYLRRPIAGTEFTDVTSAYGYGGYVSRPCEADLAPFHAAFSEYCRGQGIVSEFIRFHPAFANHLLGADSRLEVLFHQPVVAVDYAQNNGGFEASVKKEVWKKLRRAQHNGVRVIADDSGRYTGEFIRLYEATMERLHAHAFYYFEHAFFRRLHEALAGQSLLFGAVLGDRLIGGLLVLYGERAGYNFLSCSDSAHNALGTNELLQYTALEWAHERRLQTYLLGGGKAGEDSLFQFKAKFSPQRKEFYTGRRIHLPQVYWELCRSAGVDLEAPPQGARFPLYRNQEKHHDKQ